MEASRDPQVQKPVPLELSDENTAALGKVVWLLAEDWNLSNNDLSDLLDVKVRTIIDARARQRLPMPSHDRYRRVGLLLGIKKSLEILFPHNPEVRGNWLKVKRETFKGLSALEMIQANRLEGLSRLFTIRRLLDMLRNGSINAIT